MLWSESVCALRSQVTGLLQHRQNATQDSSQDAAAEECPSIPTMPAPSHMPAQAAGEELRTSHLTGDESVADDTTQPSPDREEEQQEDEALAQASASSSGTAAAAPVEADGSALPPALAAAAPDGDSAAETDGEEAFGNATRFDHAQVLLSVYMSALRSGVSRIATPQPVAVR